MASRMPRFLTARPIELALGTIAAALFAVALAPSTADAKLFGAKKPPEDFTVARAPMQPISTAPADGAIFHVADGYGALTEGWRARRVGDPLTIVLVERTAASKSASSKLDSAGAGGLTPPSTGPLSFLDPNSIRASGNRNFNGAGSADQANSLSGEVSVTVAQVYPNGTMLVQGQKRVTLNRGDEYVQIKGLVRMADVDINNRVLSTRVADAQIAYTGKGDVARASRQGWLARFFGVILPF